MSHLPEDRVERQYPAIRLSVIVPVFNEATNLAGNAEKILDWLDSLPMTSEFILVNDGSTDNSASIIGSLAKADDKVIPLGYEPNRGRGHALRTGLLHAAGDIVVTTEADLSWDLEDIRRMIEVIESGDADVALASPHTGGGTMVGVPATRIYFSRMANLMAGFVVGHGLTMATGMTRAYRREVIPAIISDSPGKEFHLDVICRAVRHGLTVSEVPALLSWHEPLQRSSRGPGLADLVISSGAHLRVLLRHLGKSFFSHRREHQ